MLLVTGITGRSGRFFLQELAANRYEGPVRCVVRPTSDTRFLDQRDLDIQRVVGDLGDQHFMDGVMAGVDTVLHIASISYSTTVARAAINADVRRAIFVHTTGIYSRYKSASSEYKDIEAAIDEMLARAGSRMGLVYLRPTMIYGDISDKNISVFIRMVDRLSLIPVIDGGSGLLQPVNRSDLGKAYYRVLMNSAIQCGSYVVSGERPMAMREMLELIAGGLDKNLRFISVPLRLGVLGASVLKVLTLGRVDYVEKVLRMVEDRSFPYEAARLDFGYSPMPFDEGLAIEIEEYLRVVRGVTAEGRAIW